MDFGGFRKVPSQNTYGVRVNVCWERAGGLCNFFTRHKTDEILLSYMYVMGQINQEFPLTSQIFFFKF